jgi:hypothetical protein
MSASKPVAHPPVASPATPQAATRALAAQLARAAATYRLEERAVVSPRVLQATPEMQMVALVI